MDPSVSPLFTGALIRAARYLADQYPGSDLDVGGACVTVTLPRSGTRRLPRWQYVFDFGANGEIRRRLRKVARQ